VRVRPKVILEVVAEAAEARKALDALYGHPTEHHTGKIIMQSWVYVCLFVEGEPYHLHLI
jgi:hypothetical protein